MHTEETVQYLFLDLNSYFASIEQQECPDLRGKPIAVVPMPTDSTCAIAASYEAKAYGIKTGTKIYDAKRLCPTLTCVLARHHLYVDYHERLLEEFVKHTPIRKVWSIDEWSSYLPPNKQPISEAIKLAQRIKQGIWHNVGEAINCSIGLAPNGLLAKIASDMQKPNGLTTFTPSTLKEKLFTISLDTVPGIGTNMLYRLNKAGIWTMEDFWNTSPKQARKIWGSVQGERMWYQLHGFNVPDIITKKSMIGHSRILDPHLRPPDMAKHIAKRLTIKAAQRLRRSDHYAKEFVLSVRSTTGQRWTRIMHCQPSNDSITFLDMLTKLWDCMLTELRPYTLKKLAVTMHGLSETATANGDLFDYQDPSWQKIKQHREQLSNAIETLNKRFGMDTINFGIPPKTIAGYVGTKIAFSRVPDKAEFNE